MRVCPVVRLHASGRHSACACGGRKGPAQMLLPAAAYGSRPLWHVAVQEQCHGAAVRCFFGDLRRFPAVPSLQLSSKVATPLVLVSNRCCARKPNVVASRPCYPTSPSLPVQPNYMAPELFNGTRVDEKADLYSLGEPVSVIRVAQGFPGLPQSFFASSVRANGVYINSCTHLATHRRW